MIDLAGTSEPPKLANEIISILKKEASERGSISGSQRSKKVSVDVNFAKEEKASPTASAAAALPGLAETDQENAISPNDRDEAE